MVESDGALYGYVQDELMVELSKVELTKVELTKVELSKGAHDRW